MDYQWDCMVQQSHLWARLVIEKTETHGETYIQRTVDQNIEPQSFK